MNNGNAGIPFTVSGQFVSGDKGQCLQIIMDAVAECAAAFAVYDTYAVDPGQGNVVIYNTLGETVYQGNARHFNNQKPGAYLIKAGKDVKKVICK